MNTRTSSGSANQRESATSLSGGTVSIMDMELEQVEALVCCGRSSSSHSVD